MSNHAGLLLKLRARRITGMYGNDDPRDWSIELKEGVDPLCMEAAKVIEGQEQYIENLLAKLALAAEDDAGRQDEYICKCGIRVIPHRCQTGKDF